MVEPAGPGHLKPLDLCDPRTVQGLARRVGLSPKKGFGQNFLIDRGVLDAIVEALQPVGSDAVLEIGPGLGTLTRELAGRVRRIVGIELDPACLRATAITLAGFSNAEIVRGDALQVDPVALGFGTAADPAWVAAGNLPYNLTTPLLGRLFELGCPPLRGVFLVQREVADRLAAPPGGWSLATVVIRSVASVERLATIPASSFDPPPRVTSAIIRMRHDRQLGDADRAAVIALAKRVFQLRRKTLRHGMTHALGDGARAMAVLGEARVDPVRRPETLDLAEWRSLAHLAAAMESG